MPLFQNGNPTHQPAEKRISLPASQRLTTITEGQNANATHVATPPPIPRRSSRRNSLSSRHSRRWSGSSSEGAPKPAPPPYDWVSDPPESRGDDSSRARDEKLAWLRRGGSDDRRRQRGGWVRLALIIGLVLLVIIGLAVGLGIGLTRRSGESSQDEQSSTLTTKPSPTGSSAPSTPSTPSTSSTPFTPASDDNPPQKFPLGEYSLVTALMGYEAACAANPATWRCYPDIVYSVSTTASSMATFNWIISNTSAIYATSSTAPTPEDGVPANLTVRTTDNPFGISFNEKPLTYISSSGDPSSARYTFTFTMDKQVNPLPVLTQDNAAAVCFYNQTTFTGSLYSSTPRTYPPSDLADSVTLGGYEQWPYGVEVTQTAHGGTDVPNCYKTVDGVLGDRIFSGVDPQPSSSECLCDYRNF